MVVRDRLKELQEKSKHYKDGDLDEMEMKPLNPKDRLNMTDFFQAAEEIALGLNEIQKNVEEIKILQKRVMSEPSKTERDKHQAKHNDLIDINKSLGAKVQRLIKNEIEANNKLEAKSGLSSHQLSELRLRKTQIATQASRYLEIWREYSNLQIEFREKTKAALAKNIKITSSHLTTDEIEDKIEKGDFSVFSSAIIQETAAAKEQLAALESRHADFLKLEESISVVHSMFIDVNNLVQMQGEMVTRIEDHVNNAVIDVEKGREDLGKAQKYKQAAMKKKFILIGILVAVVIIVLLIILYEFGAFSGGGGGTTIVEKHIYHYSNGTQVEGDAPVVKDETVVLGSSSTSTTTALPTSENEIEQDYI